MALEGLSLKLYIQNPPFHSRISLGYWDAWSTGRTPIYKRFISFLILSVLIMFFVLLRWGISSSIQVCDLIYFTQHYITWVHLFSHRYILCSLVVFQLYINTTSSIRSPVNVCFQDFAIMNHATINTVMHVSLGLIYKAFWGRYLELGHREFLLLLLWQISLLISIIVLIYIPTNNKEGPLFITVMPALIIFWFLDDCHSFQSKISPVDRDFEHFFLFICWPFVHLPWNVCLFHFPFIDWVFNFRWSHFFWVLYILDISPLAEE